MKKNIHRSNERGKSEAGWLSSRFSFSFSDYYNPRRMGFGKLRVLNDDVIEAGKGFGSHQHNNMEIITIPIEGQLAHKDSTGVEEIIEPGEIQVMSAGSGIIHSEYNYSGSNKVKILQIWIETKEQNIKPRHDKRKFDLRINELTKVVSGDNDTSAVYIHQDAKILLGKFDANKKTDYEITNGNGLFIFVISGKIKVDDDYLTSRDSIEIWDAKSLEILVSEKTYFMVIEVPM